jgi:hypothetical protein
MSHFNQRDLQIYAEKSNEMNHQFLTGITDVKAVTTKF